MKTLRSRLCFATERDEPTNDDLKGALLRSLEHSDNFLPIVRYLEVIPEVILQHVCRVLEKEGSHSEKREDELAGAHVVVTGQGAQGREMRCHIGCVMESDITQGIASICPKFGRFTGLCVLQMKL
jgi:hypothetical protein